ncbi:GNAT family N-acetyltransferase [Actinospica sp.]|jgi:polar amino acid transport system permease protein|uniref:GNAT family N-acetyltransferase n=1 Tax=Actinospica sp. TaxID=1872142 RepID=UPI002C9968FE|nr:GNAT family N-acetyltransferase [Actinospica sp.]HWG28779.1 GNAT family N-acetyltransferase [Actinospica sp.]
MVDTDSTTATMARPEDPGVAPLLAGLLAEYTERYGPGAAAEFDRNPTDLFTEERGGALVLLVEGGQTVAGGALRAFDFELAAKGIIDTALSGRPTAEFKRIWTHAEHRRRGLGRRVLDELERRAADLGYEQVFLTTGPSQPEAVGLYLAAGYTELSDLGAATRGYAVHPFVKALS